MAIGALEYPASPLSSQGANPTSTTEAAQYASFEVYDNSEIELVSTARGATPFLSTLIGLGRQKNGGQFDTIGLTEQISKNFPSFSWKEEGEQKEVFVIDATANSAATTLVLVSTVGLIEGNVIRNATTNEQLRVSSVTNATDVVVQRAVGTKTAEGVVPGDKLIVIGTAVSQGVASVGTIGVAASDKSNYFQKFVTTVSTDDFTNLSNKVRDKNSMNIFMKDRAIVHYRELEKAALFGQKKSGTDANGKAYYTMEGVVEMAKRGWTHDISSALTRGSLEEALGFPLRYTKNGSSAKIALCGTKVKAKLSELFEGRLQTGQIKEVNLEFEKIKFGTGEYTFVYHPMMDEDSGYDKSMVVVDPAFLNIIYPSGQDLSGVGFNGKTKFVYNKSVETVAYQEGSYFTYATMMNSNSDSAGLFKIVA
jgi:hypothetical protein